MYIRVFCYIFYYLVNVYCYFSVVCVTQMVFYVYELMMGSSCGILLWHLYYYGGYQ